MNTRSRMLVAAGFVALSLAVSVYALPRAPDQVATHWNAAGQADGTMPRLQGLLLLPALAAGVLVLLALVPRIDPLGENVRAFREYYDWFVVFFTAFMAYVNALVVAYNLGYGVNVSRMLYPALGLLFVFVGVVLDHAERNWFVGVRTPWTLSSDEVWEQTHELGAKLFKLSGVVALFGVLVPEYAVWLAVGPVAVSAAVTTVYSFVAYRRLDEGGDPATE